MTKSAPSSSVPVALDFGRHKISSLLLAGFMSLGLLLAIPAMAGKPTPPTSPSGLTATAVSGSQINLAWVDTSSNETGFYVDRGTSSAGPWTTVTLAAGSTSYSSVGLTANTTYYYRVGAYNAKGTSYSTTVSATTSGVSQPPPCTFSISPTGASPRATAATGSISVTASASTCSWTASSSDGTWLTCSPTSGAGSASVTWSVTANSSTSPRTGTITVAGQSFTVTQAAATPSCTYSISPASVSPTAAAASGSISVTASGSTCSWTASSSDGTWLTCSPASGAGSASVTWSATANTSASPRTATITVAGQTFTVTQAAASTADVALSNGISYNDSLTAAAIQAGWNYYYIDVPSGASSLVVDVYNVSADADLYVKYNAKPTLSVWDCRPYIGGVISEQCTLNAPTAGRWWIGVNNWSTGTILYTVRATFTQPVADTTAPTVPTSLTATAASSTQINLSWGASTDTGGSGLAGYRLYRGTTLIATTAATSYSDTGLAASSTYCYTVLAYDNANNSSAQSAQACATTTAAADTTAPTATLTAPASGSSLSGTITLSANASDNVGVSRVEFYVDSTLAGTDTTSAYAVSYNTASLANGTHTVSAKAYDAAGNVGTSAGVSVTVANCSYSISPTIASPAATASSGTVAVTATAGCVWASSSAANWITITSGTSGTGNGTVYYSVAANSTTSSRTGTMTIAGQTFTVNQAAGSCSYSISPTAASAAALGGSGSLSVTASAGCAWTASSGAAWITITAGGSGAGNGTVSYSVAVNSTTSSRAGTLTVAGQTFTVTQAVDTTAPAVSLTSPAASSTVSGTITLSATASDPVGISRVEFYRDNTTMVGTATAGYSIADDTTKVSNGSHTYNSKAYDLAGNSTTSPGVAVTVNNNTAGPGVWSTRYGGLLNDIGSAVTTDPSGNIVLAGWFKGSANFGGSSLTSSGGADMVLAKYSSTGVHQWSCSFGGSGDETVTAVALDASGNIFVGGYFTGNGNFGGATFTSVSMYSAFVAKYSPSGQHLWSQAFGSANPANTILFNGLAVDSQGNVVVVGTFQGSVSFGGTTLVSTYGSAENIVVAKYSPTGNHLWSKTFAGYVHKGNGVAVDRSDNVLLTGSLNGYIDFGGGMLYAVAAYDNFFLAKFTSAGAYVWAKRYGGPTGDHGKSIAVDGNGDVAIFGDFYKQTDLGGGALYASAVNQDMFVAKYAGVDGSYVWGRTLTGNSGGYPQKVIFDGANNLILSGYYFGTFSFGGQSLTSLSNSYDGFVAKYDALGGPRWAVSVGGTGSDSATAAAADGTGYIIVTGYFGGTAVFGGATLVSAGGSDTFLLRMNP